MVKLESKNCQLKIEYNCIGTSKRKPRLFMRKFLINLGEREIITTDSTFKNELKYM